VLRCPLRRWVPIRSVALITRSLAGGPNLQWATVPNFPRLVSEAAHLPPPFARACRIAIHVHTDPGRLTVADREMKAGYIILSSVLAMSPSFERIWLVPIRFSGHHSYWAFAELPERTAVARARLRYPMHDTLARRVSGERLAKWACSASHGCCWCLAHLVVALRELAISTSFRKPALTRDRGGPSLANRRRRCAFMCCHATALGRRS
jgi:hypothetical protein